MKDIKKAKTSIIKHDHCGKILEKAWCWVSENILRHFFVGYPFSHFWLCNLITSRNFFPVVGYKKFHTWFLLFRLFHTFLFFLVFSLLMVVIKWGWLTESKWWWLNDGLRCDYDWLMGSFWRYWEFKGVQG